MALFVICTPAISRTLSVNRQKKYGIYRLYYTEVILTIQLEYTSDWHGANKKSAFCRP